MLIAIRRKLTKDEAEKTIMLLEEWFKNNPKRKICKTDWFKVNKKSIREDVLEYTES